MKASFYITNSPPKYRRAVKTTNEKLFKVRLNRSDRRIIDLAKGTYTKVS